VLGLGLVLVLVLVPLGLVQLGVVVWPWVMQLVVVLLLVLSTQVVQARKRGGAPSQKLNQRRMQGGLPCMQWWLNDNLMGPACNRLRLRQRHNRQERNTSAKNARN
jgi:hypothetical protein